MMNTNKKAPKLRFKGFTDDWEQRKLNDFVTIRRGLTYKPSDIAENGIRVLRSSNIDEDQFIKSNDDVFVNIDAVNIPFAKNGDILITSANGSSRLVGKHTIINDIAENSAVHGGFMLLAESNNPLFTDALLSSNWYKRFINTYVAGGNGAIGNLSKSDLESQSVMVPSEHEQIKIGQWYGSINQLITLHQCKLEKLKLTKKALLQKLFPKNGKHIPEIRFKGFTDAWEQRKLGNLATVEMNKRIFKEQTTTNGDIPFYKIGTFGSDADSFISRELFEEYKNKYPYPNIGDILISASGSIGRTVVYNGEDAYYQDSNIVWLNHNGLIDNSFLLQFYNQVKWAGLEASTIKRLYNKNILETNIALPKIEEQRLIGKFFKLVDSSITLHQCKLDRLISIKKALLQQLLV